MTAVKKAATPPPKAKKKPSVAAREAEAEDGFVTIEQCGITLRIPVAGKIPVAAQDAFRERDNYEGTKQLVGKEQWQRLSDAGMTMDELGELGAKIREALGN